MTVTLKLKSGLDRFMSKHEVQCKIDDKNRVIDVLKQIRFPIDKVGIVLIDGKKCGFETVLHGGELIKVFPPEFN